MVNVKKQQNTEEQKETVSLKDEMEIINFVNNLPTIDKQKIIDAIARDPFILQNKEVILELSRIYEPDELSEILGNATLKNNLVLQIGTHTEIFNIGEDVLMTVIKNYPSDIYFVKRPSLKLCMLAFKEDPDTYQYIYKKVGLETMVDAIAHDPNNIIFATKMEIYDRNLYKFAATIAKRRNDFEAESNCDNYLYAIIADEKRKEEQFLKQKDAQKTIGKQIRLTNTKRKGN